MKRIMRGSNKIRRGFSLLLMMSMLIVLLPTATAAGTVGAYGSCTVTTKNVVIRTSPQGPRTGFFAQKGTYPMIGPIETVDGVDWYNIQTSETAGFVSGLYATASYGSAGMPSTSKVYVDILADTVITLGSDPLTPSATTVTVNKGSVLQIAKSAYSVTIGGSSVSYINFYYYNGTTFDEYYTPYTNDIANGVMSTDNLNNYIYSVVWANYTGYSADSYKRQDGAKGDLMTHAIQAALNVLGYYDDTIDGSFGTLTKTAVGEFQDKNSISKDYIVGPTTYAALFLQAIAKVDLIRATYGLGSTPGGTSTTAMIQTTIKNLRIRKSYTTSSAYVGIVPNAGTILTYTRTQTNGTVTWYYVQYDGTYGWVMGTYVTAYTTTPGTPTTPTTISNWGTVTITKKLVAIRVTANGKRTGYHVNTGDVCTLIGPAVTAGGYTWYYIRTENGRTGYVRGDCATAQFGSAGMPDTTKKYVQFLYDGMSINVGADPLIPGAAVAIPKGTVLQLYSGTVYTSGGEDYLNVYFNNALHYAKYTNALKDGLMSQDNVNNYISGTIWAQAFGGTVIAGLPATPTVTVHTGDVRVHAIQAALFQLGLYTDTMDGMFGNKTATAVIKFKKNNGMTEDDIVNTAVSTALFTQAKAALQAKLTAASGTDTGDGTVPAAGDFGTVNTVKKGSWSEIDGGAKSLFPKGSVVTVMSVTTKQVFRLYRWSGTNHADCVPYDTSDTATLASIVGFTSYTSSHPTDSQLTQIKAAGTDDYPLNTWPDFRGGLLGTAISGTKEKIPVWVNLNGTVYCASIYTIPHGFDGVSGFSKSKLNGQYYYDRNNMYGMLCVHFYGSTTHTSGTEPVAHTTNINTAYNQAAAYFGASKVK